jgi:hypothetical protein
MTVMLVIAALDLLVNVAGLLANRRRRASKPQRPPAERTRTSTTYQLTFTRTSTTTSTPPPDTLEED